MLLINFIRGFCMALADSVPGVSGGTIAFILGFYNKFISSLNGIFAKDNNVKKESLLFMLKLAAGWIVGMVIALKFLSSGFESQIYNISSLFVGLIVFSIPIIVIEEKDYIVGKYRNIVFLVMGVSVVGLLTFFNPVTGNGIDIAYNNISFGMACYILAGGIISIAAMVLPGISGSTILVILGLYSSIIVAINKVLIFDFRYLSIILIFIVGIIIGIRISIRVIKNLLENYRSQTIYTILGLMIGSIYSIFMGPTSLEVPKEPLTINTFSVMFFIIGCVIMIVLQWLKIFFEKKEYQN